jgi:hypothetical protein
VERSALLPAIDLEFLTSFLGRPSSGNTLIELERALAAKLATRPAL